jgi:hypothetical protein
MRRRTAVYDGSPLAVAHAADIIVVGTRARSLAAKMLADRTA